MTLPESVHVPGLSGERFFVHYRLLCPEEEGRAKAEDICIEQTIEFPADLAPAGDIPGHIFGRIESLEPLGNGTFSATISYAVETVGSELTQLLNVIFGNISIKPGIRVERIDLPASLLAVFRGPRFGLDGLRERLQVPHRPLLSTALKPMGLSASALAALAYQFALGGIDIIKDDHGLADQPFCPFEERVAQCAAAVARANRETGLHCIYMPHITAPTDRIVERALFAREAGAGGLLVCPGLAGFDTMRLLADDDRIALPVMSHPAFIGSYTTSQEHGIAHYALYGQLMRLAGADATIFPNYGGRFAFSEAECRSIVEGCTVDMGHIRPIVPAPGGGMTLERIADMSRLYGQDVIYLIGGGLHRHGPDLVENARYFARLVQQAEAEGG